MKKYITTLCFIVLIFTVPFNKAFANDGVLDTLVEPFFTALQSGDIEVLNSYVGGVLYQKMRAVSKENPDYGIFLRKRYAGAIFYPTVIQQDDNDMIVSVNVDFQEKGTSAFELLVQKDNTGIWRIVEQYSPTRKF